MTLLANGDIRVLGRKGLQIGFFFDCLGSQASGISHGIISGVANLTRNQSEVPAKKRALQAYIVECLDKGMDPPAIARKLAPKDAAKRKKLRSRIWDTLRSRDMQAAVSSRAQSRQVVGLLPAVQAVNRRAAKGNIPAAKLLMETSGYHDPKHKVEHSGEVVIKVQGASRPAREEKPAIDVPEADVVDD